MRERGKGRGGATQAYPKVRAEVLDRYKRLYLGCYRRNRMLFKLPVASICKHNKRRDNDELQDNKKSKNNSIQASYDPDDKDMRWYKTIDKITR